MTESSLSSDSRYTVVSIDGHVGPSMRHQLRSYCPGQHLEEFDAFTAEAESHTGIPNGVPVVSDLYERRRDVHSKVDGLQDADARLRDLDAEGIAGEVLFHGGLNGQAIPFTRTTMFSWTSPRYFELEAVGVRIYNRWLADFVGTAPARLAGVAHLPIGDVAACVEEAEFASSVGLKAANLPAPRPDLLPYNDPAWEPVWAACAAGGLTLTTHGGAARDIDYTGPEAAAIGLMEGPFFARRALWVLILSGVFNRHPALKFATTEVFCDWVPETLLDMDTAYESYLSSELPRILPAFPSVYWRRNCYVGCSFMSAREAKLSVEAGYADRVMWGADYPHPEGTWPRTKDSLRMTFSGSEPKDVQGFLARNAIEAFGMDAAELDRIGSTIGPTEDEISRPIETIPDEFVGFAFRQKGKFA